MPKKSNNPVVARGRDAWEHLKHDAPVRRALSRGPDDRARERRKQSQSQHRGWWLEVGKALMVGKRLNKTSHLYSAWVKEHGFEEMGRKLRQNAIWFSEHIETLGDIPDGMANPATIRQWARGQRTAVSRGGLPTVPDGSNGHGTEGGFLAADDIAALRDAIHLLREAADHNRRSLKALGVATNLIYRVSSASKRRGVPSRE